MRTSFVLIGRLLLTSAMSPHYHPEYDCSNPVNMRWPPTNGLEIDILQELHTIGAEAFRDEARNLIQAAKSKRSGDIIPVAHMTGAEIESAKFSLLEARFSDLQAEICRDVSQLHRLQEEANGLKKTASALVMAAKARLLPGTDIPLKDIRGPEVDKAKRALLQAREVNKRVGMLTNLIHIKRARYDRKLAAKVIPAAAERLRAVQSILVR